jgi:competence protein ComEC
MDWWLFSFFIGALLSLFLPIVPVLFLISLCFFVIAWRAFPPRWRLFIPLFSGIAYIQSYVTWFAISDPAIGEQLQGSVTVSGQVDSLIVNHKDRLNFTFIIETIDGKVLNASVRSRLSWRQPTLAIQQGQRLKLMVKLKPRHGLANSGGFSYQTWLLRQNIHFSGYVKNAEANRVLQPTASIRQRHYDFLNHKLEKSLLSPLLLAIATGDKQQLTQEHWQVLSRTGTQHLMAISGLHLSLVAAFAFLLGRILVRCYIPTKVSQHYLVLALLLVSLLSAFVYAYLAGFAIATLRALLMLTSFIVLRLCAIHVTLTRWLLLTVTLILLLLPLSLLEIGFWLSLSAVCAIFFILHSFRPYLANKAPWQRWLWSLILIQLAISLILLPLLALLFAQVSWLTPVANIIAVPLASVTVIPLTVLASGLIYVSEPLGLWLFELALLCMHWLWSYLQWLSSWSPALTVVSQERLWQGAISVCVLLVGYLGYRQLYRKQTVVIFGLCCVCVYWLLSQNLQSRGWRVTALDVGQGLAIVIEHHGRALLYDSGASFDSGFQLADHAGGVHYLLSNDLVSNMITSIALEQEQASAISQQACLAGQKIYWQQLTLEFIWSTPGVASDNDHSCVLYVSDGKHRVLLSGDISNKVEQQLLQQGLLQPVDLLIAPHHGSKTSSSGSFVKTLNPGHVVFSAGYLNRWHMPHQQVVERYRLAGSRLYNTSENGMLVFEFSQAGVENKRYRQQLMPFWFINLK